MASGAPAAAVVAFGWLSPDGPDFSSASALLPRSAWPVFAEPAVAGSTAGAGAAPGLADAGVALFFWAFASALAADSCSASRDFCSLAAFLASALARSCASLARAFSSLASTLALALAAFCSARESAADTCSPDPAAVLGAGRWLWRGYLFGRLVSRIR
ncbi:hypothetical protein AAHB37_04310 [Glutamicibacter halophytocola]|uniref:hypothetical protein n=1 Tax=Glutamicibacter halophytocola TaxID=1933880 RepID=UPI00321AA57D